MISDLFDVDVGDGVADGRQNDGVFFRGVRSTLIVKKVLIVFFQQIRNANKRWNEVHN